METINIQPTWRNAVSIIILALTAGNKEGRDQATQELLKMADTLDKLADYQKTEADRKLVEDKHQYGIYENIANIADLGGAYGYYTGNSVEDMTNYIKWGKEFEEKFKEVAWGENEDYPDYFDAIYDFALTRMAETAQAFSIQHDKTQSIVEVDDLVRAGKSKGKIVKWLYKTGSIQAVIHNAAKHRDETYLLKELEKEPVVRVKSKAKG